MKKIIYLIYKIACFYGAENRHNHIYSIPIVKLRVGLFKRFAQRTSIDYCEVLH